MVWLYHRHKIDEDWTINVLRLFSESDWTSSGVKESPIWECVEVDKYICPIFTTKLILLTTLYIIYLIMVMNMLKML